MASTKTGELFTDEQVSRMSPETKRDLGLVAIKPREQQILELMTPDERKRWLKANKVKKPTRRELNKRERQNKRAGRAK